MTQFRGGMNEMVRQAARMQRKVEGVKNELKTREFSAGSAGDKIRVSVTGDGKLSRICVDPEFLATEGLEMVCDAITVAANTALASAERIAEEEMNKATGGIKLPGMSG